MDAQLSQDSLSSLIAVPDTSVPVTPEPAHATIPDSAMDAVSKVQSNRVDNAASHMTPPPSTQVPSSQRAKDRTPTPIVSHISTPPPTIELPTQSQANPALGGFASTMTTEQIASASVEDLRTRIPELQSALQEAKMSAAHHRLQYQMLSQESAAAIERMAVEARMAQYENEVIHVAEQARAAATPIQPSPFQDGMIPVQKDLYQRMCREIQQLTEERNFLANDQMQKEKIIVRQDHEIGSLSDKVMLMRERIRENREHLNRFRRHGSQHIESTPRSTYTNSAMRSGVSSQEQPQPFAALLQASEMASQEASSQRSKKAGHTRNTHSTSSLPSTPHHRNYQQIARVAPYQTPSGRQPQLKVPSTAPQPRTSAMRTPDVYSQHLPVTHTDGPGSDGTVSASDEDSEAETDILDPDEVSESQASRTASQMLKSSHEKRDSFKGSGMLKQSKLFGAVKKAGVERSDERPVKRARTGEAVGLGIAGMKQ